MSTLVLVTGAGASKDLINPVIKTVKPNETFHPPLTGEIFIDKGIVDADRFPGAFQIGSRFTNHDPTLLEKFLLSQRDNESERIKREYQSVPLYLSSLFLAISDGYLPVKRYSPTNYANLLSAIDESQYSNVIWINLNYDTFGEKAIQHIFGRSFDTFDSYFDIPGENTSFSMVKPHGSCDWFYGLSFAGEHLRQGDSLITKIIEKRISSNQFNSLFGKTIYLLSQIQSSSWKQLTNTNLPDNYYPALVAPLGIYEYVNPEQMDIASKKITNDFDLLCIGYGGKDEDINKFIKNHTSGISKAKIIAKDSQESKNTHKCFTDVGIEFKQDITEVCDGNHLSSFIRTQMRDWLVL